MWVGECIYFNVVEPDCFMVYMESSKPHSVKAATYTNHIDK